MKELRLMADLAHCVAIGQAIFLLAGDEAKVLTVH